MTEHDEPPIEYELLRQVTLAEIAEIETLINPTSADDKHVRIEGRLGLVEHEDGEPANDAEHSSPARIPGVEPPDRGASPRATTTSRRLYRGLKGPYDPARPTAAGAAGVDFTDCPLTALMYADGRRGAVLVVEVEPGAARVSEELWLNQEAKRFMFWGRSFQDLVVAQIPAKELRAQIRRRGIVTAPPTEKAMVLRRYIAERIRRGPTRT